MKTLLLNPPSFEKFDGGAGSRWPARREITSYWYPVWLSYPAGLIRESRLLDAPPHGVSFHETAQIAKDYEFMVLFTSTAGFQSDVRLAEAVKDLNPHIKTAFVGPPVSVQPEESLKASHAIDFVVRREFELAVTEFAQGKKLETIAGASYRRNGSVVHNPARAPLTDLDSLPFAVEIYKRDLDITRYNIPFLKHPFVSFYTSRGCPALCTYCLWPQTFSGHKWRTRSSQNVAAEVRRALELFPQVKELFFDDDTFAWGKARTIELCAELKKIPFTWSCNCRVHADYEMLRAMKEAGCRLLIVGFESSDPVILKNIKKGATVEQARLFMKNCRELGLTVHGDFIIGLPGETRETIRNTIRFAEELDCETIQVSIAHPFPGTEFDEYVRKNGYLTDDGLSDELGHQLPNIHYPGLSRQEIVEAVEYFYGRYYFRPRIVFRILRRALFDGEERSRLYKEAREYLTLRARRKKFYAGNECA
ncbi:MAG: hopanoid biosynthesis associated radical SAM protein HpnJ [Deltaproteobacteria bacterium]|nr:hopanoid biosynthesis associated radical SAM protein HpnJ [Deltaproteobacteria bacterium]